jgi:Ca-activated chloride channel family protein
MLQHIDVEHPYAFILLGLIFCVYKCPHTLKEIIFPHIHFFRQKLSLIEYQKLLYSLIIALLVTALASPISYESKSVSKRKGRDLVFVLDTSGSMAQSGYDAQNRSLRKFDTLTQLLKRFIQQRYDDNVGVALFGSYAYSALPLSYDMKSISFLLDFFDVGIAGESTAIGEGIARGLEILQQGDAKSKVMILFSDGHQNSGAVSIKEAVQTAKEQKVKIYTVGIGKNYDEKLLQKIAQQTDAKMFQAEDANMLSEVYEELNRLEPSKIKSQNYLNKKMLFIYPLAFALFLMFYLAYKKSKESVL